MKAKEISGETEPANIEEQPFDNITLSALSRSELAERAAAG